MATTAESSRKPSLWGMAAKSTRTVQAAELVQAADDIVAPVTRSMFGALGGGAECGGKDVVSTGSKRDGSLNQSRTSTGDDSLSKSFFVGILDAINVVSSDDNNKEAVEINMTERAAPPPIPSRSSLSFMSRWSSVGSSSSPLEPTEGKGETPVADTKWRTSLLRESGIVVLKRDRPSVYEESLEMIVAALLIYTFADLRSLARKGKITFNELTKHPISISQVMEAINTHREALEDEARIDQDDLESRLKALKHIHDKQRSSSSSSMIGRVLRGSSKKKEAVLTHFHDEKSTQGMVYGIAVNQIRKRITVIFRGSVTQQDFVTDVKLAQKKVNNPVAKVAMETPTTINIHTGFYQYLFKKDDTGRVRIEHILDDVKALMKKHKGYRLYCTGHSLGGALASLCGFYAATDPKITKNGAVVVVSVASPRVGNDGFRTAFQDLEKLQLLQHLRISNKEDVVTLLPFVAWKETSLSPSMLAPTSHSVNLYKHCGIHLKFKQQSSSSSSNNNNNPLLQDERQLFSVTYAKDKIDDEGALPEDLKRSVVAAKSLVGSLLATRADFKRVTNFHCCDEYERRLENCKNYLDNITLDHLYADKDLVGSVVAGPIVETSKKSSTSRSSFFGKRKSTTSLEP